MTLVNYLAVCRAKFSLLVWKLMQCHSFFYLKNERTLDATDSDLIYTDQRLHFMEHSHGIKNTKLRYVWHFNP